MKLCPVVLTKHETCKTYAFKRIGMGQKKEYHSVASLLEDDRFEIVRKPKKGDLLLWIDTDLKGSYLQNEIKSNCKVITNWVGRGGHVGVFESNGICSDAHMNDNYEWQIRCRSYRDLTKPDYILRLLKKQH